MLISKSTGPLMCFSVTLYSKNYTILDVLDRVKSQTNAFQKQAKLNKITKSARSNHTTYNHETYQSCCAWCPLANAEMPAWIGGVLARLYLRGHMSFSEISVKNEEEKNSLSEFENTDLSIEAVRLGPAPFCSWDAELVSEKMSCTYFHITKFAISPGVDPILVSRWLFLFVIRAHFSLLLWIQEPDSAGTHTRMLLMRCWV